jgi:hypothetical protein
VVPESPLESTEHGLAPTEKAWFVLDAPEAPWWAREGRGLRSEFEGLEGDAPEQLPSGARLGRGV